jgi:hypothetical protein
VKRRCARWPISPFCWERKGEDQRALLGGRSRQNGGDDGVDGSLILRRRRRPTLPLGEDFKKTLVDQQAKLQSCWVRRLLGNPLLHKKSTKMRRRGRRQADRAKETTADRATWGGPQTDLGLPAGQMSKQMDTSPAWKPISARKINKKKLL